MDKIKEDERKRIRKLVDEMTSGLKKTPIRRDGPSGGKWDRTTAEKPTSSGVVGKKQSNKAFGSKSVVNTNEASESIGMKIQRNEKDDFFALPICRERRLYCRCAYCCIRKRLDNSGHADNQYHRTKCPHCQLFQERETFCSGSRGQRHNFQPIVAIYEVFIDEKYNSANAASILVDKLATALNMRTTMLSGQIGYIEQRDDEDDLLYTMSVTSEALVAKLHSYNEHYKKSGLIIFKDLKNQDFEDLQAFWNTGSTLQFVAETRGACLRDVVENAMDNALEEEPEDNDEDVGGNAIDNAFEEEPEENDENLVPAKFTAKVSMVDTPKTIQGKKRPSGEPKKIRKKRPYVSPLEYSYRPSPKSAPKKNCNKALSEKKSQSCIEYVYVDDEEFEVFNTTTGSGSDVAGPSTSSLDLEGPSTSSRSLNQDGPSTSSRSGLDVSGPSINKMDLSGFGNSETDVEDSHDSDIEFLD